MVREILPPWSEYRKTLGVEEKEEFETFGWMVDTSLATDLTTAKEGLKSIEGGAEFLKTHIRSLDGLVQPMMVNIYISFGPHHSGASSSLLANTYKSLLNDWDGFVLATKDREKRKVSRYDERQIDYADSEEFLASAKKGGASHAVLCDTFRAKFNARYDNERLLEIMKALRVEENHDFVVKSKERAEKRLLDDIDTLTFLYKCPIRWFLKPYEVVLSSVHIEKMCAIYPDYEEHFETVMIALTEWEKRPSPESKPSAIFFEVFDAPDITPEQIEAMTKFHPDYAQHIERIKETRATQMQEQLLGKMFVTKPVLAAEAAADRANQAWHLFNQARAAAEKAQREAEIAMAEAEAAKRDAMVKA
jgi:hypothetical protein